MDFKQLAQQRQALARANPQAVTRDDLVLTADRWWRVSYGALQTTDDDLALQAVDNQLFELGGIMNLPDLQLQCRLGAMWAQYGLRQVVMGEKLAASLMCTRVHESAMGAIVPPWPCFLINVPPGLLAVTDQGRQVEISFVHVMRYPWMDGSLRWAFQAHGRTVCVSIWRFGLPTEWLVSPMETTKTQLTEEISQPLDDQDDRCVLMIGRLITGVCMAMTDPSNIKAPPEDPPARKGHRGRNRDGAAPRVRTYMLQTPTSVDCRQTVSEYVLHGTATRKALSVQTMVAGHWKNQPCGPKQAMRKIIWVEPYWRGPEDAPISGSVRKL